MKRAFLNFFVFLCFCVFGVNGEVVRRGAFDFGSGSIKMQISDVDLEQGRIVQTIETGVIGVPFSEDLFQNGGIFSDQLLQSALDSLNTLKQQAEAHGVKEFGGFATEAFRQAENSSRFFEEISTRFGIPVRIVSQHEEGELGFNTAVIIAQEEPNQVVVWDTGAGSVQFATLTESGIEVVKIPAGAITSSTFILSEIQGRNSEQSSNPMTKQELVRGLELIKQKFPEVSSEWMSDLQKKTIIAIGAQPHAVRFHAQFHTLDQVRRAMEERLGKTDQELSVENPQDESFRTGCLLISLAVMEKYGIEKIKYYRTGSGNATAFLVDPKYWENSSRTII